MNRNMLAKLNTMSIGDSLTGVVTESTGRLYWGITRLTQVQYELVLTRPFGNVILIGYKLKSTPLGNS